MAKAPNIVLILADDLGQGDLSSYNPASKAPTPFTDQLAADGVRFNDAHSPSAVCTPTRYGILTGRYAFRTRMKSGVLWGKSKALIEPGRETMASMLKSKGYQTACIGKWHLGLDAFDPAEPDASTEFEGFQTAGPHTVGFDYSYVIPASLDIPPYTYVENGHPEPLSDHTAGSRRRWDGGGGFWREGQMSEGFDFYDCLPNFTRRSAKWVEEAGKSNDPFFLYMPLPAPHTPWMPTEEFQGKSGASWYGDFVHQVDHTIGEIMKAVEATGKAEDTIFIVTSDNGSHWRPKDVEEYGHDAHNGFRGMKADAYEGGHRVPLIIRWPGEAPAGKASDALVGLNDIYAMVAEVVGHEVGEGEAEDSVSFLQAVTWPDNAGQRDHLIHHSVNGSFAIRMGRWKLIDTLGSGGFTEPRGGKAEPGQPEYQLFNMVTDEAEQNDVAADWPTVAENLLEKLAEVKRG